MKTCVCVLLISLLTGCVPFHTNTDGIPPPFGRILVVSKLIRTSPTYLSGFVSAFPVQYEVCTVDVGPLSFGNPDSLIRAKAVQCKSDVMLTLAIEQNLQGGSGKSHYNINDILLEMATLPNRKPFWKAITPTPALSRDALSPQAVVRQLLRDHIITGVIPAQHPVRQFSN